MILQGQNPIDDRFFDKIRIPVCLGRIELPILPMRREHYRREKGCLGEREAPVAPNFNGTFSGGTIERIRTIDKSKVAFKVTDISGEFSGGVQHLYGCVESCGIAPNLRSIVRTTHLEMLCFMPRVVIQADSGYDGGFKIVQLITFDLVPFQADETLDRRSKAHYCAVIR